MGSRVCRYTMAVSDFLPSSCSYLYPTPATLHTLPTRPTLSCSPPFPPLYTPLVHFPVACILPLFTCSFFYSVCLALPRFPHFCCSLVPFMLFDFPSHFYSPLQYTRHFLFTHFVDVLSWCIHCYYNVGTILSDATIEM